MSYVRFIQHLDGVDTFGRLLFAAKEHFPIAQAGM